MKKWVEYAVENYKGKNSFGFQLAKDLKERQIGRAIERYARGVQPEEVAALLDTSAFKSGKTGFLLTDRYLYSDRCKEEGPVSLMFLKSVSVKQENNSRCVLTFRDDSTREMDISVFLDVVDVLNLIIEQKEKYEAEEKEREGQEEAVLEETGDIAAAPEIQKEGGMLKRAADRTEDTRSAEGEGASEKPESGAEPERMESAGIMVKEETLKKSGIMEDEISQGILGITIEEGPRETLGTALETGTQGDAGSSSGMCGQGNIPESDGKENEPGIAGNQEESSETETGEMAIEIVQIEDLDEPEESEEAREMRWLADFIQSEELDWGDDTGDFPESQSEKDWIDETDEKTPGVSEEQEQETGKEETAETEEKAAYDEVLEKAKAGDREAMYQTAVFCYTGEQTSKDLKQALHWFRESAKSDYVPAMLQMMRFYKKGELVKQNLRLGMSWVKKAAATGEAEGRYALAEAYIFGETGKQDVEAGLKILDEMAADGDETAQEKADEVRRKVKKAKERFDAGIRQPSTASGYYEMGVYCQTGDGFYTYPKEAVQYFKKAAEKEHVHAQYQLALAFHTGEGIKKNEDECVKWLEKAAAKSHKEAMELLDEILEKQRIKREKTEFKNHLRQAEKGDAYAQSKVAELYLNGTGVKQDVQKGIEWYEKASEADEGYAARQLVKIYSEGKYVPEDQEKAAYWRMVGGLLEEL